VLGTEELNSYLSKYRLLLDPRLEALVGRFITFLFCDSISVSFKRCLLPLIKALSLCRHSRKPWTRFINAENQHLAVPEVYT